MTPSVVRIFVLAAALVFAILLFLGDRPSSGPPNVKPAPVLWMPVSADWGIDRKSASSIVLENYMPSYAMLNAGVDAAKSGRWITSFEGTTARCSGNCWYVEYHFPSVDAQGSAHEVKCEWIVDVMRHIAVPRNEEASYYWMSKK